MIVSSLILILIIISTSVLCVFIGVDVNTLENLLINFIINLVFLIFTVIILDRLFAEHHKRLDHKEELTDYLKALEKHHQRLASEIRVFIAIFLMKSGNKSLENKNDVPSGYKSFDDLFKNYKNYIQKDFVNKKICFTVPSKVTYFGKEQIVLTYNDFMKSEKEELLSKVNQYIILYFNIMPKDILKALAEIQSLLQTNPVFSVYNDESTIEKKKEELLSKDGIEFYTEHVFRLLKSIERFSRYGKSQSYKNK